MPYPRRDPDESLSRESNTSISWMDTLCLGRVELVRCRVSLAELLRPYLRGGLPFVPQCDELRFPAVNDRFGDLIGCGDLSVRPVLFERTRRPFG